MFLCTARPNPIGITVKHKLGKEIVIEINTKVIKHNDRDETDGVRYKGLFEVVK